MTWIYLKLENDQGVNFSIELSWLLTLVRIETNLPVCFLGEVTARQFCFEIYWPLGRHQIQLWPFEKTWALLNVWPKILQLNFFYLVWMWVAAVDFMSLSLSIAVRVDFFFCHGANFCHNSLMPCLLHQSFIVEIHNHWELLMDHGKSIIFQNNRDLYNKFFKIVLLSKEFKYRLS